MVMIGSSRVFYVQADKKRMGKTLCHDRADFYIFGGCWVFSTLNVLVRISIPNL